jgi:catechol 2,3-dioxygenase-like lactoylglutathione lyase family enzyme
MKLTQKLRLVRLGACFFLPFLTSSLNAQAPAARPKITGIYSVTLKATDFDKSRVFYQKVLGLDADKAGCASVTHPCYAINAAQHVELIQAQAGDHSSFLSEIAFAVSNVKQMQKYLEQNGVHASAISRRPNQARFIEAEDPEHHRIAFIESPGTAETPTHEGEDKGRNAAEKQLSHEMLHAGFVVKDLETMKKFYLDLLGFRLYWYGGFKDDGIDWYEIQAPDGNNWVEFMLNIAPTADHQELGVQNHFSLGVRDAGAAAAKLRAHGATTFDGPEVGRDGKNSLDIYDPDLSRVEVMEFTPSQTPCCHPYTAAHPQH